MQFDVASWWLLLCAVALFNMMAWTLSAAALQRWRGQVDPAAHASARAQLLLSAGYVFGCAYRSAFPVFDIQRVVVVDSWMSSVLIGRSVATLAELCFVAQWALMLSLLARQTGSGLARRAAKLMLPMIVVAELCSWHAVLSTSNLGHVIEESLWGAAAAMLLASLLAMWRRCAPALKPMLALCCAAAAAYVAYMFMVDVPMYWQRWLADEASGRAYLSIGQGWVDAGTRWVVSHRWDDWKDEVVWMSLYFGSAVWLSISLVHVALRGRARQALRSDPQAA